MSAPKPLKTRYEFVLPRGYVDDAGRVHRKGTMRLATARDELDPLRDPLVNGPDDPRITILVLTRVVERLGDLEHVSSHEIENLFAVDLAYLQDFYGVINFGTQAEYDELLRSQATADLVGSEPAAATPPPVEPDVAPPPAETRAPGLPPVRAAVEEIRRQAQ